MKQVPYKFRLTDHHCRTKYYIRRLPVFEANRFTTMAHHVLMHVGLWKISDYVLPPTTTSRPQPPRPENS